MREQVFGWHRGFLKWYATKPGDVVVYMEDQSKIRLVHKNGHTWITIYEFY